MMSGVSAEEADQLYASYAPHVTKGLGRSTEGVIKKASGSRVQFYDGREMLDFTCGIGVTNLGGSSRLHNLHMQS